MFHFRIIISQFISAFLLINIFSCSSSPTGRKRLTAFPESQMAKMGDSAYEQLQQKSETLPESSSEQKRVQCIVDRLLLAMGEKPAEWETKVFRDDSPNAFALPGKNIGVHTGMIQLVENDSQLAAVIGHEIGHVKAKHGNERASQRLVVEGGLVAAQIFMGGDPETDKLLLGALGVGAQFGYLLPFSRKHETEADELGLDYMSKAGFDPRQASELWKIMAKKFPTGVPEFLSTHPNSDTRAKNLGEKAPNYLQVYEKKPSC